jgi:hypothetical protein
VSVGVISSSSAIQNPSPSKSCSTTALAEPMGLFSDLAGVFAFACGALLFPCGALDDSLFLDFFLGLQHSCAQCPGLPQLWQLPWRHFLRLPSNPVAASASSVFPSLGFFPCPCWPHKHRFFRCLDSLITLFMSVSVSRMQLLWRAEVRA